MLALKMKQASKPDFLKSIKSKFYWYHEKQKIYCIYPYMNKVPFQSEIHLIVHSQNRIRNYWVTLIVRYRPCESWIIRDEFASTCVSTSLSVNSYVLYFDEDCRVPEYFIVLSFSRRQYPYKILTLFGIYPYNYI